MWWREKRLTTVGINGERCRKYRHRISAQIASGSGDPNAREYCARNTELHPTNSEIAVKRYTDHPESQVVFFFIQYFKTQILKSFKIDIIF